MKLLRDAKTFSLLGTVLWLVLTPIASRAEVSKLDLFEGGTGGYALYRIPGVVVTAKGTVLAYCEARRTGKSDWDTIDILLRRSTDRGRSWNNPVKIANVSGPKTRNPAILEYRGARADDVTYNNPVAIAGRDGTVHFLFCLEYMRCFYQRSTDDGQTWSQPVEITQAFDELRPQWDWKVLATGPGHGIELRSGRLLVPTWLSTGTGGGNAHRPSITSTIYSDDAGQTWRSGVIAISNSADFVNPSEATAVQLSDGRVLLNGRTESKPHRRVVTTSTNGASGWSAPRFDEALLEPICMASMIRLRSTGAGTNILVFSNPHNLERASGKAAPGQARDRRNLSLQVSFDGGATWPLRKVLEPGPSAYSDLAETADGGVLCFYERRLGANGGQGSRAVLTLAMVERDDLLTEGDLGAP